MPTKETVNPTITIINPASRKSKDPIEPINKRVQNQLKVRLIELVNNLLDHKLNKKLSPEQKLILSSLWFDKNFNEIAELHGRYSPDHLERISESLWNLLSYAIEEEINTNNFKTVLQHRFYPKLGELEESINLRSTNNSNPTNKTSYLKIANPILKNNNNEINNLIDFMNESLKSQFNTLPTSLEIKTISGVLEDLTYEKISLLNNTYEDNIRRIAKKIYKQLETIFGVKINKKNLYSTLNYYYKKQQNQHKYLNNSYELNSNLSTPYILSKSNRYQPEPINNTSYNKPLVLLIQIISAEQYKFKNLDNAPVIEINLHTPKNQPIDTLTLSKALTSAIKNLHHLREDETITVPPTTKT